MSSYLSERAWDLSDVVDVKYGTGIGLGVKAEATIYFGLGLGLGEDFYVREWFGRMSAEERDWMSLQVLLGGGEGNAIHGSGPMDTFSVFGIDVMAEVAKWPGPSSGWRFGGEVMVPFAHLGLYLNVGELVDFLLGIGTLDVAGDDGIAKWPLSDS
ncbi:MAG: hypothetical protein ACI9EF_004007 [Pseudohongiellaceae bacterium]|jgi:hypothetical protein